MPKTKFKVGEREIEAWYAYPPILPDEWLILMNQLHPVTAIVVWEVLTGSLSPATIALAQSSPDWDRFTAIRMVGGGNPKLCTEVAEVAREEMEEIFKELLPNYASKRVLQ